MTEQLGEKGRILAEVCKKQTSGAKQAAENLAFDEILSKASLSG
jgi:hypothetical protein